MSDEMECCGSCKYARPVPGTHDCGEYECHRYPPNQVGTVELDGTKEICNTFPRIEAHDWCGEYSA